MNFQKKYNRGFTIVELIVAIALLALIVTPIVGALSYSRTSNILAGGRSRATYLAKEGLEAVRNLRDNAYSNLTDGPHGIIVSGGGWTFSGASSNIDNYQRVITIETVSATEKKVTSTVTWQQTLGRPGNVTLVSYLSNWSRTVQTKKGGVLVYGDGGTTTDAIKYRIFNANTNAWSAPAATADVDAGTTNRALRAARLYSSATRNEKIIITRHYNGTTQYVYGQVWNGTVWGNVQLLSSWNANTFLDVQNFDGTYLQNGDFMTVYSDNTTTPKFRTWNGSVWSAQVATQNVGGIPNYIVIKQRPSTNEVMAAVFDQQSDTNTEYFNGGAYATASWTLHAEHSTQAPVNTKRIIDFEWNLSNTTKGIMTFSNNQNDRNIRYKMFTANGSGGGSWSNVTNGANQGSSSTRSGVLRALSRPNAAEFLACSQNTVPQIICYQSNTALTITDPTNQIIAPTTDAGIQKAFDFAYEQTAGTYAISVYSDGSVTPRLKKYDPAANSFDAASTNMTNLGGTLKTVRTISQPTTNDIMILLGDSNRALYSQVWNGTGHALYTSADAWGFNSHGTNGSAIVDYYFDFAWDNN